MEEPSKVFALPVEGLNAGIRMPPFWFGHSSKSFYKTHEASGRGIEAERYSSDHLSRRSTDNGRIIRSSITSCSINTESPRGVGIHSKLLKITTFAKSKDRISGVSDRFKYYDTPTSRGEVTKDSKKMSGVVSSDHGFSVQIV